MDSEITGLANLRGYLKAGNLVVRMSFPVTDLPKKHPMYIERPAEIRPEEPPKKVASAAGADGALDMKITQHEIKQDREQTLAGTRTRQERFFQ
jgi:hypothetical protein